MGNPIHEKMSSEHARLERLLSELENAVAGANAATIWGVFTEFERGLTAHFDVEEKSLFPALPPGHESELRALRADHERIRRLVADLGIRADLHTLRKDVADDLLGALRAHAEREDRTVYEWAGHIRSGIFASLAREIESFARERVI
jgi:hemerythrin-like domain-containing protein